MTRGQEVLGRLEGKRKLVNFITASKIESKQEFIMSKYKQI